MACPIVISKLQTGVQKAPRIPGTFPSSVRYGEQVISTGIPSLDHFIGGGLPLGSICIIRDNFPSKFSDMVMKCFIAEAASYNHHIFVGSGVDNSDLVNDLPSLVSRNENLEDQLEESGDLKIAWRYGHQQKGRSIKEPSKFEFSKKVSASELGGKNISMSKVLEEGKNSLDLFPVKELLHEIHGAVRNFVLPSKHGRTGTGVKFPTNLVRICLSHCEEQVLNIEFIMGFQAIVRNTNCCALITVSAVSSTLENLEKLEHFADYVIYLQAVADEKRRSQLGDIDGICEIVKTASINSLKLLKPPKDIGFSFKKYAMVFHELNLPPEGEITTQRETTVKPSASCGMTIKGKSIDF